jgi:hypothetical protein
MIELAFGAAHLEWPNSIVGGHLDASTGDGGVLPKQILAFRKEFGGVNGRGMGAVAGMKCGFWAVLVI